MNNPMLLKELQYIQDSSGASEDGSPKSSRHTSEERINKTLKLDVSDKIWFLASSQCQMPKLKELYGVDSSFINKKDFFTGYSALHWASKQGKCELVHWLCDLGADVNLKSNGGYTPLHLAVMNGRATIVDILITDYEADINTRDYSGKKPGNYATSDAPNWVQMALRTNRKGERTNTDLLSSLDNHEGNLTVMHGRPVSRSWGSFKHDAVDDGSKPKADHRDQKENGVKLRTKSLLQSFRRIRNKDKPNRSKDQGEKQKNEDRAKNGSEVCHTPRTRNKQVQIEHPHFEESKMLPTITTTASHADEGATTRGSCEQRNDSKTHQVSNTEHERDTQHDSTAKHDNPCANGKLKSKEYKDPRTDKNSNQWKISTMV